MKNARGVPRAFEVWRGRSVDQPVRFLLEPVLDLPVDIDVLDLLLVVEQFIDAVVDALFERRGRGGLLVVLLILFFLLGKRSGKKKTTLVEIRRL